MLCARFNLLPYLQTCYCWVHVETGRPAVPLPAVTLERPQVRSSHRGPPGFRKTSRTLRAQLLLAEGRRTAPRNEASGVARRPQGVPHGDAPCWGNSRGGGLSPSLRGEPRSMTYFLGAKFGQRLSRRCEMDGVLAFTIIRGIAVVTVRRRLIRTRY